MYLSGLRGFGLTVSDDGCTVAAYTPPTPASSSAPATVIATPPSNYTAAGLSPAQIAAVGPVVAGIPAAAQPTPTYLPYGNPVTMADGTQGYADGNGGILSGALPAASIALAPSTAPSVALTTPAPDMAAVVNPGAIPEVTLPMGGVSTSTALLVGGGLLALYFLSKKKRRT